MFKMFLSLYLISNFSEVQLLYGLISAIFIYFPAQYFTFKFQEKVRDP